MIKRIIQMVVVILLTIPLLTHAQTVTIEDAPNQPPGSVSLNINMSGFSSNGGSMYLQIEYDDNLLEYIDYTSAQSFQINANYLGNSVIALNWANSAGASLSGTFITLNFTYNGGFSNTLEFIESVCEIADVPGTPITGITYVNGTITPDITIPADGTTALGIVDAIAGGVAAVPLTIVDGVGFGGVAASTTLRIGYDTEKLVYSGVSDNSLGFSAGEDNGVITLVYNGAAPLTFPLADPLLNIDFDYLGGGVAAVDFLSGSIVTDVAGTTILVTEFVNGQVNLDVPPGSGTLSIARKTAEPGEVEVAISASGLSGTQAGVLEMKIAYDDENLDYKGFSSVSFPAGWTSSQSPGYLTFSLTKPSGFTINDGEVLTLAFDYFGNLANITFEPGTLLKETNEDPIPVGLSDGWVTPPLVVNTKVYLQGAYTSNAMSTNLNTYLPSEQPYDDDPWNYEGEETVTAMPANVVDWVLVELRTGTAAATFVAQRAGLLLFNGSIVDTDGTSLAFGDGLQAGDYYIVIKHRFHLAIMSRNAQALSTTSTVYDFTTSASQSYGNNALKDLGSGSGPWGLYGGDGDGNGIIFPQDFLNVWVPDQAKTGYYNGDWDMNSVVFPQDFINIWVPNQTLTTKVP